MSGFKGIGGPELRRVDPEVAEALRRERRRQTEKLELIASENFASQAVLDPMGCPRMAHQA